MLTKTWSKSFVKQAEIIDTELVHFFSYFKKEMVSLSELEYKVTVAKLEYETGRDKMVAEREKLFVAGQEKWGLSKETLREIADLKDRDRVFPYLCVKEQKEVDYLRVVFGHYLENLAREKKRISEYYAFRFENHFKSLASRNLDFLSDSAMMINLLNFKV